MEITGRNIIGFKLSDAFASQFRTFNPVSGKENDFRINEVTREDALLALEKAASAARIFAQSLPIERASFLENIAVLLEKHSVLLCSTFHLESGLGEARAQVELKRTVFQLREFAALLREPDFEIVATEAADLDRKPNAKPALLKVWRPIGPVVVFGASNFPFAYSTIGGDSASALAAGCPVIVKAHPMHAGTGDLVAQLVLEAAQQSKMPDGVFSNLNAQGYWLGEMLTTHPNTKAVGFTGSLEGGMALYRMAQNRPDPIPFFAEMGSVNPILLLPSVLKEPKTLVKQIAQSITSGAGQFCTNPGLVIAVDSADFAHFGAALEKELQNEKAQVMLHPDIARKYHAGLTKTKEILEINKIVSTNKSVEISALPFLAKVSGAGFLKNEELKHEVFGMHTILVGCSDKQEMQTVYQSLSGQLTTSFFGTDAEMNENSDLLELAMNQAGRIIFNGVPTGVEVSKAMTHGGPFPATSDARFTAVGRDAIYRFLRPLTFQNFSTAFTLNRLK